jgi:membrane protein implicated in regulation of membrane protease activity
VGLELPVAGQWLLFAVVAVTAMFTLRRPIYAKLMNKPFGNVSTDLDQRVVLTQELAPGKSCRIQYRGSGWTALNVGDQPISSGGTARIDSIEGVTLRVRAV